MGQDLSKEDFLFLHITQNLISDQASEAAASPEPPDALLDEIVKRIRKSRSEALTEFVFYTRHRSLCGAPTINRWSYQEDELRRLQELNDGFPMAATLDEIREFDKLLIAGKNRKQKKKQRSRSFSNVVSEASRRLPALSRPRFVDKIITGYSSLTRRSPGKKKQAHRQLTLEQSTSCFEFPDIPAADRIFDDDFEIVGVSEDVRFCSKCGLPILFEDVKNCSAHSEGAEFMCLACHNERSSQHASQDSVPTQHDDGSEYSQWINEDLLRSPFPEQSLCNSEESRNTSGKARTEDPYSDIADPYSDVADSYSETADPNSDTIRQDLLISSSDINQCYEVILESPTADDSCSILDKKQSVLKGEQPAVTSTLSLRHPQKISTSPHTEQVTQWPKNYYSLTRNETFSQEVMAKGYVKALAEQINQQGSLKQSRVDEGEGGDINTVMSMSSSSVSSCKNDEIPLNMVHSLIQAAEQQKFKDDSPTSPAKKADLSANNVNSNNLSDPNDTVLLNSHLVSDFLERANCVPSLSSTNDKHASRKDVKTVPGLDSSTSSHSLLSLSQEMKSGTESSKSSPSSPPEESPSWGNSSSNLLTKSLQSPSTQKPPVNYARKPSFNSKTPSTPVASTNAQTSSSTPLPSSSSPSAFSPKRVTPPKQLPPLPPSNCSLKSPSTPHLTPSPKSPSTPSLTSPATHSPHKSSLKSPSTPPTISNKALSVKSPFKKPSPNLKSPSQKIPSFIALTIDPQSPSPTSPPKSPSKSAPPLPKTPLPTELHTAKTSPHPLTSSHHSNECIYANQTSIESSSQPGTVEQWLSESHSSLASVSLSDEVCLRPVPKRSSDHYRDSVFKTIYDNQSPLNAAELFDSSWSDSDSLNGVSDDEDEDNGRRRIHRSTVDVSRELSVKITEQASVHLEDRRLKIAEELLQTERDYVARLHLLHHVFYFRLDNENRQQAFLPADTLKHMFSNIKSIFLFHNDFLLPQLGDRMKNWENDSRIGDLLKKNAPFLKMYTEYIRNFDRAMKLINQWMEKSAKFSEIIQDIQKLPECHNLSLQHHMLGPIQRVPRYELLLKDYVRHLPEGSPDMSDAKDALDLVTKAACHSNEAMKKIETFHKLLDIYQSLRGVPVDFISPTREFVTQGPVTKIAARSGERQPRQIFLFNDLVLICTQYNLLGTYSVRSLLEVDGMEIKPGTSMNIPNTFLVHGKQKAVELLDENPTGEPVGWHEKIQTVISQYKKKKRSIRLDEPTELTVETNVPESCLGKTAPVWIQDDAATMCMLCRNIFNVVRRRHHCRACGKLICKACCKKAPLEYLQGKIERVCTKCYDVIVNKRCMTKSDSSDGKTSPKKKGILHVNASTGLISGYMHFSDDGGHNWQKLWVTAHEDFVLYTFRAHEDVSAISSLPLPGHEVHQVLDIPGRQHTFYLSHKKKRVWMFQTDHDKHLKRWLSVLTKLAQAQLPDENSRLSSQSNSSNSSSLSDSGTVNNGISPGSNKRSSTHSGSQADSGYPGDSNNSLATLAVDDSEVPDGITQPDNVDGVDYD